MVRTQIQLTEEQARTLKRLAAERNVSMAALVREAVERLVEQDDRAAKWERALRAVGKFRDREGARDVARRHDDYFVEAILDWRRSS